MNMNTLYIMLGFIFVYAMISNAREKIKKRNEKSKEAFERLQTPAYKKELEKVINLSCCIKKSIFFKWKRCKKINRNFQKKYIGKTRNSTNRFL